MNYNLSTSKGGGGNSTYLPPVIETIDIETEKGLQHRPPHPTSMTIGAAAAVQEVSDREANTNSNTAAL